MLARRRRRARARVRVSLPASAGPAAAGPALPHVGGHSPHGRLPDVISPLLFLLSGKVIHHLVLFCIHMKQSGARVVALHTVLAKANVLVVLEGAEDAVCWLVEGLGVLYRELLCGLALRIHFLVRRLHV